jgi:hypothetical protein
MADFDQQPTQLGLAHARTLADNRRMRRSAATWLLVALAGCGKSGSGTPDLSAPPPDMTAPGSIVGTVDGQPFSVAAVTFYSFGPNVIQISTDAMACSDQVNEVLRRNSRDLLIQTPNAWAMTTYNVDMMGTQALAYWRNVAADCTLSNGNAVSGTVTITALGSNALSGTLDLTFDVNHEHITGRFDAVPCAQNGTNPPVTCP